MVEDNMITLTSILHDHGSLATTFSGVNLVKFYAFPVFQAPRIPRDCVI